MWRVCHIWFILGMEGVHAVNPGLPWGFHCCMACVCFEMCDKSYHWGSLMVSAVSSLHRSACRISESYVNSMFLKFGTRCLWTLARSFSELPCGWGGVGGRDWGSTGNGDFRSVFLLRFELGVVRRETGLDNCSQEDNTFSEYLSFEDIIWLIVRKMPPVCTWVW